MAFFKTFACCKIVRGASRSVILDLQRGTYETIPNDLVDVIDISKGICVHEVLKQFDSENKIIIKEFFDFLIKREYGFWCDSLIEFSQFPDINDEWDNPNLITNAIIDVGKDQHINYPNLIEQIKLLTIPHIQIRSSIKKEFSFYENLILALKGSRVTSLELVIPFDENASLSEELKRFIRTNLRIKKIIFHNSPFNQKINIIENLSTIYYIKRKFDSELDCGVIDKKHFMINIDHYTESQNHNSCLNRKICIDVNGGIKNCPSLSIHFGNIKEISLQEVLKKKSIDEMWHIHKDKIDVCKDCEFRYICTDCRAYLKDNTNRFSQPQKCNYNPYIAKWKGEKGYISVEKSRSMQFYD